MVNQIATEGFFRRIPVTVEILTTDGRELQDSTTYAKGDPWAEGCRMTDEELAVKVRNASVGPGCTPAAPMDMRRRRLLMALNALECGKNGSSDTTHDTLPLG